MLLVDQLKQIYINGQLEILDTSLFYPAIRRKDFTVGVNFQTSGPDPDPILDLFYGCGSSVNWDGYCNHDVRRWALQGMGLFHRPACSPLANIASLRTEFVISS